MGIVYGLRTLSPNAMGAMPVALLLYPCRQLLARWTRGRSRTVRAACHEQPLEGMHGLQCIRSLTWHQLATAGPKVTSPSNRVFPSPPVDLAAVC